MKLRFVTDGEVWAEVDLSAEHWAVLKREARKAHLKAHDFVLKVILDYCDMVIGDSAK